MRWEVRGADASTGDDRLMVVEGLNSEEVEAKARYSGMLVASITPVISTAPVVAYALPEQQRTVSPDASAPRSTSSHTTLRIGARVLQVVSVLVVLAGVLFIATGVRVAVQGNTADAFAEISMGIFVLLGGIAAHVFASVALLAREIAHRITTLRTDGPAQRTDDPPST